MILIGLVAVALLIAANGYFVAAEFAFVSARRSRLEGEAEGGDRKAGRAVAVLKRLSFMLSGAQLGITVTSLAVGFIAEPVFAGAFEPLLGAVGVPEAARVGIAVTIGFVVATMGQMVFGELAPKNLAIAKPEPVAKALARSTATYMAVASPFIRIFDGAANRLLKVVGIEAVEELHGSVSADELEFIVGESAEQGALTASQAGLLERALAFRDLSAADAMIPMGRVMVIASTATCEELRLLLRSPHSRFPVTAPGPDGRGGDRIVGVVHAKDLLEVPSGTWDTADVSSLMREPVAVPSSASLPAVLGQMRGEATALAVVVDEHGGEVGIITMEDLVEELVGDITDEYDEVERAMVEESHNVWVLPGELRLDEIERETGVVLPEGDYDTVAGLVVAELEKVATVGDIVTVAGTTLEVLEVERWTVERVRLTVIHQPDTDDDGSGARRARADDDDRSDDEPAGDDHASDDETTR